MGWKVIVALSAREDLREIVGYIAKDNPEAASRVGNQLIEKAELLAMFPESGRVVPEFHRPEIREIVYRNYRVIYRVNAVSQVVEIARFWHGARGAPSI